MPTPPDWWRLIASATERTTAATDLALALASFVAVTALGRTAPSVGRRVWRVALTSAGIGAAIGAVAHGLDLSEAGRERLWQPLFLLLGLTVALFVVGAVAAWRGGSAARRVAGPMLGVALLFYLVTRLSGGKFVVFVLFQAVALLFALGVYLRLGVREGVRGAALVAAGLAVTLAAGAVQAADSVSLTLIWEFDHNGVYHLIQLAGLLLLTRGLLSALPSRSPG